MPIRRAVVSMLSTLLPCIVSEASKGSDALALLKSNHFDAVLLDIDMPSMNGFDTCREIREQNSDIAILIWTVRDTNSDKERAIDAGADGFIVKPFHIRDVAEAVRKERSVERGLPDLRDAEAFE